MKELDFYQTLYMHNPNEKMLNSLFQPCAHAHVFHSKWSCNNNNFSPWGINGSDCNCQHRCIGHYIFTASNCYINTLSFIVTMPQAGLQWNINSSNCNCQHRCVSHYIFTASNCYINILSFIFTMPQAGLQCNIHTPNCKCQHHCVSHNIFTASNCNINTLSFIVAMPQAV